MRGLSRTGVKEFRDLDEVAAIYETFKDYDARSAICHVDAGRGRLARPDRHHGRPRLPHRGDADVRDLGRATTGSSRPRHAQPAAALAPGARVEVIANAGHFPHKDHPQRFAKIVNDFMRPTRPATYSRARFRQLLRSGVPSPDAPMATVTHITGADGQEGRAETSHPGRDLRPSPQARSEERKGAWPRRPSAAGDHPRTPSGRRAAPATEPRGGDGQRPRPKPRAAVRRRRPLA